jgi:hypothetical protein
VTDLGDPAHPPTKKRGKIKIPTVDFLFSVENVVPTYLRLYKTKKKEKEGKFVSCVG